MALRKNLWRGTEPMASLEIPVGVVFRTQAGYARSGSRLRLHPCRAVSCVLMRVCEATCIVQIDVDTTKVVEHEVSDGVGALDRVWVAVECFKEPRVSGAVSQRRLQRRTLCLLGGNELARLLVCPKLRFC